MRHKKHLKSVICLVMTMLMVFSVIFGVNAVEEDVAATGAVSTVYFRNTENWSTVNAYVWIKDTQNSVKAWPGEAMTLHEDNIYKYTVNGDYNMIIFNNGSTQTGDLNLGQDGYLYDYSKKTWEKYADPTPTEPTEEPQPTQEPEPTNPPVPTQSQFVYFKNTPSWSTVKAYMWNPNTGKNNGWPGEAMTEIGDDVWQFEVTGDYTMIIFDDGSNQTGDLKYPGGGYIYDYSANKWEVYDTSPLVVKNAGTDVASPQYKDTEITLTADAITTEGAVYYKFSVKDALGKTTVLKDFSTAKTAKWNPTVVGTYTLVYDFKDDNGNTNQREVSYTIEDDSIVKEPIIKKVTPGNSQVKKGEAMNIAVTASGGKVGTNLLFYKYVVKDKDGKVLNVPYYTKNATYKYTPAAYGEFTVTVYVQNSANKTVQRTYNYESVANPTDPTDPPQPPTTTPPTTPPPTEDPSGVLGDANNDGKLSILDATFIQRYLAKKINESQIRLDLSDYDKNGEVNIKDATYIQRKLANLI